MSEYTSTCRKLSALSLAFMAAIVLASCERIGDASVDRSDGAYSKIEGRNDQNATKHICGTQKRANFCPTDFTRLAVLPSAADGKEIWILGYLAIDGGQVALFATEDDYLEMQYGRSIRVQGGREQLVDLFTRFGYKKVRLRGKFRSNSFDDSNNDRLGEILPPISGKLVVRRGVTEEAKDIGVDLDFLQKSKPD